MDAGHTPYRVAIAQPALLHVPKQGMQHEVIVHNVDMATTIEQGARQCYPLHMAHHVHDVVNQSCKVKHLMQVILMH
jgi:hypothetical protein